MLRSYICEYCEEVEYNCKFKLGDTKVGAVKEKNLLLHKLSILQLQITM